MAALCIWHLLPLLLLVYLIAYIDRSNVGFAKLGFMKDLGFGDVVFGVGATMAGLAGVIAGPALVTQPSMAAMLGPILFVVIVVGGLGSLTGAFVASLLIGLVQTFAVAMNFSLAGFSGVSAPPYLSDLWQVTVAQLAPVIPYLMLVLILIFRPTGLMGTRES